MTIDREDIVDRARAALAAEDRPLAGIVIELVTELEWARQDVRIQKKAVQLLRADLGIR